MKGGCSMSQALDNPELIHKAVTCALADQPVCDMHTHLYPPSFGTPVPNVTVKTDPVFDDNERGRWLADRNVGSDPRFKAVLRIDPLLRDWPAAARKMSEWGFACNATIDDATVENARKFLRHWIDYQKAIYLAVSLPPEWRYPTGTIGDEVFEKVILPVCAERGLPFAMMIGSRLRV